MNPSVVMKYVCNMHSRKYSIIDESIEKRRRISKAEKSEIAWIHEKLYIIDRLIKKGWYEK